MSGGRRPFGQSDHDSAANRKPPRRARGWWAFGLFLGLVGTIILLADLGILAPLLDRLGAWPWADKLGHAVLIGTLAFLLNRALGGRRLRRAPVLLVGSVVVALTLTLEEVSQLWISSRSFDLNDLLANYAGIALADLLGRWAVRPRPETVHEPR